MLARAMGFARRFHAASPWREVAFDEEAVAALLARLAGGEGYLDVRAGGMIGGTLSPLYFSPGEAVAIELFWWSQERGEGRALREGFEAWARAQGARWLQASALCDANEPRVRRLYSEAGYEPAELAFRKRL